MLNWLVLSTKSDKIAVYRNYGEALLRKGTLRQDIVTRKEIVLGQGAAAPLQYLVNLAKAKESGFERK